jgi:hypothetical protein
LRHRKKDCHDIWVLEAVTRGDGKKALLIQTEHGFVGKSSTALNHFGLEKVVAAAPELRKVEVT